MHSNIHIYPHQQFIFFIKTRCCFHIIINPYSNINTMFILLIYTDLTLIYPLDIIIVYNNIIIAHDYFIAVHELFFSSFYYHPYMVKSELRRFKLIRYFTDFNLETTN